MTSVRATKARNMPKAGVKTMARVGRGIRKRGEI